MKPIFLQDISLVIANKILFANFNAQIFANSRIAIIGSNGCGKTLLLKIIAGQTDNFEGRIKNIEGLEYGYVPQLISDYPNLSGAQKFNKALSFALSNNPSLLLLDEPTNCLDAKNRHSLMQMINNFKGAVIFVSHDSALLQNCANEFWHIENNQIKTFTGEFNDWQTKISQERESLQEEVSSTKKQKVSAHKSLMTAQARAKTSKMHGKNLAQKGRWIKAVADAKKNTASLTSGKKLQEVSDKMQNLSQKLENLRPPEIIKPKFILPAAKINPSQTILSIREGNVFYGSKQILNNINLTFTPTQKLAIIGDNASGKTTLFKAIIEHPDIKKTGDWNAPDPCDIGYLDQHYGILDQNKTVFETILDLDVFENSADIRDFLNDFLFRTNADINKKVEVLSGGQRALLALAKICAKSPKLLLLDEITNNIDMLTAQHLISVLKDYPQGFIIISHDENFLSKVEITDRFYIKPM
ncbi:MAG: ATP-binding cassette domain-containing protein [Elusimicrobiota bacterium]|jgi:ATPase subunit of ABC transporter with duplicated ATPase domains|nr:ATP-binding cassette domain-containing protein [Elusimicrobiota bacterium]